MYAVCAMRQVHCRRASEAEAGQGEGQESEDEVKPMAWKVNQGETLESARAKCPHEELVADADYEPMRYYCGDCGQDLDEHMEPIRPAAKTK